MVTCPGLSRSESSLSLGDRGIFSGVFGLDSLRRRRAIQQNVRHRPRLAAAKQMSTIEENIICTIHLAVRKSFEGLVDMLQCEQTLPPPSPPTDFTLPFTPESTITFLQSFSRAQKNTSKLSGPLRDKDKMRAIRSLPLKTTAPMLFSASGRLHYARK